MSGVRIFVQGPQPMGIKHQSPIRLPGVEPRTLGGELCLMGKTTGRERLGKSAFTQLPGALGQVGAAGQGFHGDPLAEPGGPRGDSMPEQGRRFGFDAALYARLPVRAGAGVGKGRVTVGTATLTGQGDAETDPKQALLAAPLPAQADAETGVGQALGVAAAGDDPGTGAFGPGHAKLVVVLDDGVDPFVRQPLNGFGGHLWNRDRQGNERMVTAQPFGGNPGPSFGLR